MEEPRRFEAKMQIQNVDDVRVTATITMPVGDWKKIKQQIRGVDRSFPLFKFEEMVADIISKTAAHIESDQEVKS